MESEKKQFRSPENVLKNMIANEPKEGPFGIVIPLEDTSMILKSSNFSIIESYPDLKSVEPTFTLRITLEDEDIQVFEKIEKQLISIAMKNKEKVKILAQTATNDDPDIDFKSAPQYDKNSFKLVREDGEIWAKLYHNKRTHKINAPCWRLNNNKRRLIKNPNSLMRSELEGEIALELKQLFMAKHKAITCIASEVLVMNERKRASAFERFLEEQEN